MSAAGVVGKRLEGGSEESEAVCEDGEECRCRLLALVWECAARVQVYEVAGIVWLRRTALSSARTLMTAFILSPYNVQIVLS